MNQAYYTREVEKPEVLEPFVNIQPQIDAMNSMRMVNLKDAANEQAKQASDGVRYVVFYYGFSNVSTHYIQGVHT